MPLAQHLQVMVVDDTYVSRALILDCLDQMGLRGVGIAKHGAEALQMLMAKPVHLVISDMNMPEMDGLALLKNLREFKPTSRIGFILVTGSTDPNLIAKGRQLGMNNFIKKPVTAASMRTAMEAVVGKLT
jgi:two-component system chemotaxis response regulator CheY